MSSDPAYMREYRRTHPEYREQMKEGAQTWRQRNPERRRETDRLYRIANRDRLAETQRRYRLRQYGLLIEDYERLLAEQGGVCAICARPPNPGRAFHVDHDHKTGRVRGLLHQNCNTAIGLFEENPEVLQSAATYLRKDKNLG